MKNRQPLFHVVKREHAGPGQQVLAYVAAVALALAVETVSEKPFQPIGEEAFRRAAGLMERCGRVLCPVARFGEMNEGNRRLRELARSGGRLEE